MIRPTVSQSMRSSRQIADLSVRAASHATRHSKSRVKRLVARERDALGEHPVARAAQPPAPTADLQPPDAQIEVAPDRVHRARVAARRRRELTARALQPAAAQRHLDLHPILPKPYLLDPHAGQAHKPRECAGDAHVVLLASWLISTTRQPVGEGDGASLPARNPRALPQAEKDPLKPGVRASTEPHPCREPRINAPTPRARLAETPIPALDTGGSGARLGDEDEQHGRGTSPSESGGSSLLGGDFRKRQSITLRLDDVVPLAVELVAGQVDCCQVGV